MSEEQVVASTESTPIPDGAQLAAILPEAKEAAPEESSSGDEKTNGHAKPAGYDPIDPKTATPEQTQERINYLYRQLKPTQRENREMKQLLADQSRVITELSEGQRAVVNHLTERSFVDSETELTKAMNDAWKKGDEHAYIEAQNKLLDVKVQKRTLEMQPKQQPQQNNGQIPRNGLEIANRAVAEGALSQDEYRTTESWQNERDETGNQLRPWAFDSSPNYQNALFETRAVMSNPRYENWSYQQKLAEVDRRMGVQKRTASQSVMGGALTKPGKSTKVELSPKQREIALKTQYAGKGKSEAEHLEVYRKQVEKFNQRRAT